MRRRIVLGLGFCMLLSAGCGRRGKPLAEVFPRELEGRRLTRVDSLAPGSVPDDIRRLGAQAAARAVYEGAGKLEVTLYDMTNRKSSYAALRLAHETDRSAPFYHDQYFGTAETDAASGAASTFARAFERQLAAR